MSDLFNTSDAVSISWFNFVPNDNSKFDHEINAHYSYRTSLIGSKSKSVKSGQKSMKTFVAIFQWPKQNTNILYIDSKNWN